MTTEVFQEETGTPTADDLAEEAGFNSDESDAPTTTTPVGDEEEPPQEAAEPELARITREDYESLLAKAAKFDEWQADAKSKFDSAFGHIGALKQRIESRATRPVLDAEKLRAGRMAQSLGEEFGEELAADIMEALGEQEIDFSTVRDEFGKQLSDVVNQFQQRHVATELKLLSALQPGWKSLVYSDPSKGQGFSESFAKYFEQLPQESQNALVSASDFDAEKAAELIGEFKQLQASAQKTEAQKASETSVRRQRMEAAVPPRGGVAPPSRHKTEDDGWNAV